MFVKYIYSVFIVHLLYTYYAYFDTYYFLLYLYLLCVCRYIYFNYIMIKLYIFYLVLHVVEFLASDRQSLYKGCCRIIGKSLAKLM